MLGQALRVLLSTNSLDEKRTVFGKVGPFLADRYGPGGPLLATKISPAGPLLATKSGPPDHF